MSSSDDNWGSSNNDVVIGKDILELLSTSMYVDPMTVYRGYFQNATDSIDDARASGALPSSGGLVQIDVDANARSVRIRDNGTSIPWPEFVERLSHFEGRAESAAPTHVVSAASAAFLWARVLSAVDFSRPNRRRESNFRTPLGRPHA